MFVNGNEEMAGSVQQYCLRWNNHRSNLLLVFEHLFQTESFTDVTLACEGASIKCHKMVLAACSSYFQNLFIENECRHPIVILKDIKFSEIKAILEYMYRGEVNVAQDQLAGLLKAAETLRVKGLVEDNQHLSESPRSPRQSPNQMPVIPNVSEFQTTSGSPYPKNNSYSGSKFSSASSSEPIYEPPYTNSAAAAAVAAERASNMQLPIWPSHKVDPSPSPKHNVSYENTQNEPVPLKKKKFLGTNKDTPILRTVLGHTSLQHNAEPVSQTSPQTTPLHQKSLNYGLISNTSNGPSDHSDKIESPEQYMDDSIRSVESDKGHDDNPPYGTDPDDKNVQKPEWKRYKQYTRNDIMSAIEAVRQGMSALQAARKFSVPSRTLYDKVKKLGITTNRPYRKGNFPMSPYQGLNLRTDEGSGYSPEEQSSDLPGNGNGTGSFSGNGSETDCEKMDSEPGLDGLLLEK